MKARKRQPKPATPGQVLQGMVEATTLEDRIFADQMDRKRDRYHVEYDLLDIVLRINATCDRWQHHHDRDDLGDLDRDLQEARRLARRHRYSDIEPMMAGSIETLLQAVAEARRQDDEETRLHAVATAWTACREDWDRIEQRVMEAANQAATEEVRAAEVMVNTKTSEITYRGTTHLCGSGVAVEMVAAMTRSTEPVPRPCGSKWSEIRDALKRNGLAALADRIEVKRGPGGGGWIRFP